MQLIITVTLITLDMIQMKLSGFRPINFTENIKHVIYCLPLVLKELKQQLHSFFYPGSPLWRTQGWINGHTLAFYPYTNMRLVSLRDGNWVKVTLSLSSPPLTLHWSRIIFISQDANKLHAATCSHFTPLFACKQTKKSSLTLASNYVQTGKLWLIASKKLGDKAIDK